MSDAKTCGFNWGRGQLTAKNTTTNFDTAQCHVLDGHGFGASWAGCNVYRLPLRRAWRSEERRAMAE